jgi:hypothetical protein
LESILKPSRGYMDYVKKQVGLRSVDIDDSTRRIEAYVNLMYCLLCLYFLCSSFVLVFVSVITESILMFV